MYASVGNKLCRKGRIIVNNHLARIVGVAVAPLLEDVEIVGRSIKHSRVAIVVEPCASNSSVFSNGIYKYTALAEPSVSSVAGHFQHNVFKRVGSRMGSQIELQANRVGTLSTQIIVVADACPLFFNGEFAAPAEAISVFINNLGVVGLVVLCIVWNGFSGNNGELSFVKFTRVLHIERQFESIALVAQICERWGYKLSVPAVSGV